MFKKLLIAIAALVLVASAGNASAAPRVDIYGTGNTQVDLALAAPLVAPNTEAHGNGAKLQALIQENLSFLPFIRLTDPKAILGGTVLAGVQPPEADFNRFQMAGAQYVITTLWPNGDSSSTVQLRAYETGGERLLAKEYQANAKDLAEVADHFCADFLEVLIGSGDFFRSSLVYIRKSGTMRADVCVAKPTGRNNHQITNMGGEAMSPRWSPDGRFIVFSHIDRRSHALGVWDARSGHVQRISFLNSVVIGPAFLPDNTVAVALTEGDRPVIYQLNRAFKKMRVLEGGDSINVSPSFDSTGTKMAFTSNRLGGPQIFMKNLGGGGATRVSQGGNYNTEADLSPDGTLVAYARLTPYGQRIFVQDLVSGAETQVSFGPGSDEQPSFCGDSYFIAFSSTRSGGHAVYLTTRHGGDAKQVPLGKGAFFPRWGMPNGKK